MKEKNPYTIVLAEDHRILREGLRSLLASQPAYRVIGEAENGLEAVKLAEKLSPDLIIIDLSMPKMRGLDAISDIRHAKPGIKILVLTVHKAEEYVHEALRAGANGYLLKETTYNELEIAIENVLNGNFYLSPAIAGQLVEGYLKGEAWEPPDPGFHTLTQREKQILIMIAEGYKNREIAKELFFKHQNRGKTQIQPHEKTGPPQCIRNHGICHGAQSYWMIFPISFSFHTAFISVPFPWPE